MAKRLLFLWMSIVKMESQNWSLIFRLCIPNNGLVTTLCKGHLQFPRLKRVRLVDWQELDPNLGYILNSQLAWATEEIPVSIMVVKMYTFCYM